MERDFFALWFRLGNRDRYLIWFSNRSGGDGVVADGRAVPCFTSLDTLHAYARANEMTLPSDEEPILHNLDVLVRWLRSKRRTRARSVDCPAFLAAWNLFADVSSSLGAGFDAGGEHMRPIYQKLFWGNNLPAMTPSGCLYVPAWSGREVVLMHEVLSSGLSLFQASVRLSR